MTDTKRIVKNSFFLISQQLILNVVSIFIIGYIARSLGQSDYGRFIFAFNFIGIFSPLTHLGVAAVTTREITENLNKTNIILGKILIFKAIASAGTFLLLIFVINLLHYPVGTKVVVYLAGSTLIVSSMTNTLYSAFQAFERIEYVASSMFIAGSILNILSVFFLFVGFHLIGLTIAYVIGSLVGLIVAIYFLGKLNITPEFCFDGAYYRYILKRAKNFFFPDASTIIGNKIGIIFLSKLAGDIFVGIYGAASTLVERLLVFPDSICTSLYPVLIKANQQSKEQLIEVFEKFYKYLLMLGLPIAFCFTILSRDIIRFIYGSKYVNSATILIILSWWLLFNFLNYIQSYVLAAMHKERKSAISLYTANSIYIILGFFLIKYYKDAGAAIAILVGIVVNFYLNYYFVRKYLSSCFITTSNFFKIAIANGAMSLIFILARNLNVLLNILIGMIIYLAVIILIKLVSFKELKGLIRIPI